MKESIKVKPLHIMYQFLEEAIQEYFKTNTALSKGIIGCFSAAKKILRDEVKEINDFLSGKSKSKVKITSILIIIFTTVPC